VYADWDISQLIQKKAEIIDETSLLWPSGVGILLLFEVMVISSISYLRDF
jgi:hypothetical protein